MPSQNVVRNRDRARTAQSVRGRVQRTYSARNVCRCFCASGAPNMKAPPPSPSTAPFHLNVHLLARFGPWGPPRPRRASDAPRLIFSCPNFPPFRGGEGRAPAQAPPPPRPLPESSLQRWASRRPSPRRGRVPPPCVYPGHRPPRRRAETCTADDFSWWPRHRPRTFLRGPHRPQCRRSRVVVRRNASFAMHRPRANLIVIGASPLASPSPPRRWPKPRTLNGGAFLCLLRDALGMQPQRDALEKHIPTAKRRHTTPPERFPRYAHIMKKNFDRKNTEPSGRASSRRATAHRRHILTHTTTFEASHRVRSACTRRHTWVLVLAGFPAGHTVPRTSASPLALALASSRRRRRRGAVRSPSENHVNACTSRG